MGLLITSPLSAGAYIAPLAGCGTPLSRTSLRLAGGALDLTVHVPRKSARPGPTLIVHKECCLPGFSFTLR